MKRILLLAAGALGTAGMIAMAAPASADAPANSGYSLESQTGKFRDSIDPGKVVNEFLNGNCGDYPNDCPRPPTETRPGVLNQFDFFLRDLQSQSARFGISTDPKEQLKTFGESITTPPSVGEDKKP